MKYWEMIADEIHRSGWSYGYTTTVDMETGRVVWVADAHRSDGQKCVVHAGDILTAFMELQSDTVRIGRTDEDS